MAAKSIIKSIRISDKYLSYVMSYRGNTFNDKLGNIILDSMESIEERKNKLELLNEQIDDKRDEFYLLCEKLRKLEPTVQACLNINNRIIQLNKEFDECITNIVKNSI